MIKRVIFLAILFAYLAPFSFGQSTMTGLVISKEEQTPIPGVTVLAKDVSGIGTVTDIDGKFELKLPENVKFLIFNFIGMKTQIVDISGQSNIQVVMESDALQLDEMVVTALGIPREKKALGYTVQDIKSEDLANSSNASMVNALAGRVAGLRVTSSSGTVGSSSFIEIRGSNSILGNNRPLFVVDGVPVLSSGSSSGSGDGGGVASSDRMIDFNMDDIESISTLKGGAATALYGLKAANGVILITTKKGKKNQLKVDFSSSYSFEKVSQLPKLQNRYGQGLNGNYYRPNFDDANQGSLRNYSWGPRLDTCSYTTDPMASFEIDMEDYIQNWDANGLLVGESNPYANGKPARTYNPYDIFQTGTSASNSFSISGGGEKSTYYVSVANLQSEGVVPNNTFDRTNISFNTDYELSKKFKVGYSMTFSKTKGNFKQQGSNNSGLMLGLLRTPATFDNSMGYQFDNYTQRSFTNGEVFDNPYWIVTNINNTEKNTRSLMNFNASYQIAENFSILYRAGMDFIYQNTKDYFARYSNEYKSGSITSSIGSSYVFNQDVILNFQKTVKNFNFTVLAGSNLYDEKADANFALASDLQIPGWQNIGSGSERRGLESSAQKRTAAFFGDLGISYKSILFMNATAREEWSTTLPKDNNKFFYPSISFGFVFTELEKFNKISWLPYGKLRTSYAITANDASPYFLYQTYSISAVGDGWTNGVEFPFSGTSGYTYSNVLTTDSLKPEKAKSFEIGAEFKILNNRLGIDIAWFKTRNEDQLIPVPITSTTGYTRKFTNAGTLETKGIELLITVVPIKQKNFQWEFVLNFGNPKTTVIKLADDLPDVFLGGFSGSDIRAVEGKEYRTIYGKDWLKDENGNRIISDEPNSGSTKTQGYPIQDATKDVALSNVSPNYVLGITNSITLGSFTISALLEIRKGNKLWNGTRGAMDYYGTHEETENRDTQYDAEGNVFPSSNSAYVFEGLSGHLNDYGQLVHFDKNGKEVEGPGDLNTTVVAKDIDWYRYGNGNVFLGPASPYIEDASWVRLRELSVSYSLNTAKLKIKIFQALSIYFTGKNLWLKTKYSGIDPESNLYGNSNAQGLDYFNMPGTKSFTLGLKASF